MAVCAVCKFPGAELRLLDRAPGSSFHKACLPWRPTAPGWGPRRCRRCPSLGAVVLDPLTRRHGPYCRKHLPIGWVFDDAAWERVAAEYQEFERSGWRSA